MLISSIFPSKYLTASDLGGKPYTLTIKTVTLEEMITHENKKVNKPVCWFVGAQKGFVMNVTNAHIIVALYGDNTDGWVGKRITIYATKVKAFGSYQDAIRVREEVPATPKPVAQSAQVEEQSGLDDDGDIADFDGTDSLDITIDPETGEIRSIDESLWEPDAPVSAKPNRLSPAQMTRLHVLGVDVYGKGWDTERPKLVAEVTVGAATSAKELTPDEAAVLIRQLEAELTPRVRTLGAATRNGKVAA
jgi:hypothetical protein